MGPVDHLGYGDRVGNSGFHRAPATGFILCPGTGFPNSFIGSRQNHGGGRTRVIGLPGTSSSSGARVRRDYDAAPIRC